MGGEVPQKKEEPEESVHMRNVKVAENASKPEGIPSQPGSEEHQAQTKMPDQAPPKMGKMGNLEPGPHPLKQVQNKLDVHWSGSKSKIFQTGQNSSNLRKLCLKINAKTRQW